MLVKELIEKLRKCPQDMKCVVSSGYSFESIQKVVQINQPIDGNKSFEREKVILIDFTKLYSNDWLTNVIEKEI